MEKIYSLLSTDSENQGYLNQLEEDFDSLSKEDFYQKYEKLIHPVWDEESFYSMAGYEEGRNRLMISLVIPALVKRSELLMVDWSGEDEENQVVSFINKKLERIYKEKFTVSATQLYEEFDKIHKEACLRYETDKKAVENRNFFQKMLGLGPTMKDVVWTGIKRGDHLLVLFKKLDQQLKERGYRLVNFDQGDDSYYLAVFSKESVLKLNTSSFPKLKIQIGEEIR